MLKMEDSPVICGNILYLLDSGSDRGKRKSWCAARGRSDAVVMCLEVENTWRVYQYAVSRRCPSIAEDEAMRDKLPVS